MDAGKTATAVVAAVLVLAASASVRADGFLTPFIGRNMGGDAAKCEGLTDCTPKRTTFGVSLGKIGVTSGFEEDVSYSKNFFGTAPGSSDTVFSAMSNALFMGSPGRVRMYFLSGVGIVRLSVSRDQTTVDRSLLAFDVGAGANAFFTTHLGLRFDIRRLRTLQDADVAPVGGKLSFWRASLGLALKF